MIKRWLLYGSLRFYQFYLLVRWIFFKLIQRWVIVNKNTKQTLDYYLGKCNQQNNYFVQITNYWNTYYLQFNGLMKDIDVSIPIHNPYTLCRKMVVLLNETEPIPVDLQILDNYRLMVQLVKATNTINLMTICQLLSIDCKQVMFLTIQPLTKTIVPVCQLTIFDLYLPNNFQS